MGAGKTLSAILNNLWYQSAGQKTHARLEANAEEWAHYHTLYREVRQSL